MTTDPDQTGFGNNPAAIEVAGIPVDVVRKRIKHIHLAVCPPDGRVRVSAPFRVDDDVVRAALAARISWIRRKQAAFRKQARQSRRELVTGESHWFRGNRYRLNVVEAPGKPAARLTGGRRIELRVRPRSDWHVRAAALDRWYRSDLQAQVPSLVQKWEPRVGREVAEVRIRRMKTLWGSCNPKARRIWLNLELAKKPPRCVEYVFVHEMVHFFERRHNEQFMGWMDALLPHWRSLREELNRAPVAHENWRY